MLHRTLAAVTAAFLGLASQAQASPRLVTLFNDTGYKIDSVFVAPTAASSWDDDILGGDSLAPRDTVRITFGQNTLGCRYDLAMRYASGDTAEWHDVDLCAITTVHLRWNSTRGVTTATEY